MSSLFPEVDKDIIEIKKLQAKKVKKFIKGKMFEPSNSTDGMMFDGHCQGCSKYDFENPKCDIEAFYWSGTPQKEIIETDKGVICIKHSDFILDNYLIKQQK